MIEDIRVRSENCVDGFIPIIKIRSKYFNNSPWLSPHGFDSLPKCSAPPSEIVRATAVMTTCLRRIRWVASATRAGSSASRGSGLAVDTAQKWQARVQLSPAIMKVAVPLLQHSQ
jgi:hypothetical protein